MSVLVLDCGSSALKATIFTEDGTVHGEAQAAYPERANRHRRPPGDWWDAAVAAVAQLAERGGVTAISLSGTMENLVALDEAGEPLGEAVIYTDPVGATALERLAPRLEALDASGILGNAPEPLMSAFKFVALRDDLAAARWLLPGSKDYLALRMTSISATDAACSTTTGLMDIGSRTWSDELVDLCGIDAAHLPAILPADAVVGPLLPGPARALGVPVGIPVINGAGDGAATTLGSGAGRPGESSVYLGTSGWVAGLTGDVDRTPRPYYRLANPLDPGLIEIAPILSAGAAAQWARGALGVDILHAEALAATADEDPGGALFLPYLSGERSPFVDLDLRGGFAGLDTRDGAAQLYYAVLEGVAFAIASNVEAIGAAGDVFLVGGGARSKVWPQVMADVLGRSVTIPRDPVLAASLGAFRAAARALHLPEASRTTGRRLVPRPSRQSRIERHRRAFAAMTTALRQLPGRTLRYNVPSR